MRYFGLIIVIIGLNSHILDAAHGASSADYQAPYRTQAGPLRISMSVENFMGKRLFNVTLLNPTDEFYCIDSRMFDARYQHISLRDGSGKLVPMKSYWDEPSTNGLDFAYDDYYTIILPGQKRTVDINGENFKVQRGRYTYSLIFDYYRCRDAIDPRRVQAKKQIDVLSTHETGSIFLDSDK